MEKHDTTIKYAINKIEQSPLFSYAQKIILFGSLARKQERWNSDVDLFLVLSEDFQNVEKYKKEMRLLKSEVIPLDFSLPEVDLKIDIGDDWLTSNSLIYVNIRRDGVVLYDKNK